jgi:hypothetical protein
MAAFIDIRILKPVFATAIYLLRFLNPAFFSFNDYSLIEKDAENITCSRFEIHMV